MWRILRFALAFVLALAVVACGNEAGRSSTGSADFSIVSGSENKALQPIIEEWARQNGKAIQVEYLGSVDISLLLKQGASAPYDAVWPANSLWLDLGDAHRVVKQAKSIYRSPVVLALKRSIAQRLGWVKNADVTVQDILAAAEAGTFRFAMTSATQSNSGASAYLGFQYAMAGNPDMLQMEHLNDPKVQAQIRRLLAKVDRGSGSSGWLKDTLVEHPDRLDAMFNYEAVVIEGNQELTAAAKEPLCAVYPANGLMVADSPLGFVDKGEPEKARIFQELQAYLLSPTIQQRIQGAGRRTGLIGLEVKGSDPTVWNPDWCIDVQRSIAPVPTPNQEVIQAALDLYQTALRKPSLTIWVLDVSGSMEGAGIEGLRAAMHNLLDRETAQRNLLQASAKDVTIVIPFSHTVEAVWKVQGNDPAALATLDARTQALQAEGGTDLYGALVQALGELKPYADDGTLWSYLPAIVAMTDGRSDESSLGVFRSVLQSLPYAKDIPIHTIAFGESDERQLRELSNLTVGRMFHSEGNLPRTLREAKGYN
jgi:Ca-activated chloride channel family protein